MTTCADCNDCPSSEPLLPTCDDPQHCDEIYSAQCVRYEGDPLPNLDIDTGDDLATCLVKIEAALAALLG